MIAKRTRLFVLLGVLGLATSASLASRSLWLFGKANVAQLLLDRAWRQTSVYGEQAKPWPWADMRTVARLIVPSVHESLVVLSDVSGESMAFGPGLVAGDPNRAGSSAIAIGGHRDTHLAFLEYLQISDTIELETMSGDVHRYQVSDKQVVDSRTQTLRLATDQPGLVLVTCYPFNALQTGGPLRLVARAVRL